MRMFHSSFVIGVTSEADRGVRGPRLVYLEGVGCLGGVGCLANCAGLRTREPRAEESFLLWVTLDGGGDSTIPSFPYLTLYAWATSIRRLSLMLR
jgi:hypothetical protein